MVEISFASAAAAYASGLAEAARARPDGPAAATEARAAGFADMVADALEVARASGQAAEQDAGRALAGEIGLGDVVTSVTNAEITLQTVVALRDRVINAYNDILRMPI